MELPCAERQGKGCREGTGKAEAASRACARTYIYIGCRAGLRQAQSETMGMRAEETGKRTIRDNMYIIPLSYYAKNAPYKLSYYAENAPSKLSYYAENAPYELSYYAEKLLILYPQLPESNG